MSPKGISTPWTADDEARLRELYPKLQRRDLAGLFGVRSLAAICSRAKLLCLKKTRERKKWTAAEDAKLRELWPNTPTHKIALVIGCTRLSAEHRGNHLGLAKSVEYIRKFCRLQPGSVPPNKGKKGPPSPNKGLRRPGVFRGRMRETQFRKGEQPHNTLPLWSFRINTDGYLLLKTGKPGPKPNNGWEFVHKMVWEQAHGPLPPWNEARLWWKDGDRTNCALANLELVTGKEHMARTTVHNLPAPLVEVIQLKGALTRKIRNREKKQNGEEHIAGSAGSPVRDAGVAV
jgi:hypothetical protein